MEQYIVRGRIVISWSKAGGILSPLLFSSYVDVVLSSLENTKSGCFINGLCLNSFLYADDLLLLSISVSDLQLLINTCNDTLDTLDLQVNSSKSYCLRLGPRFRNTCNPIMSKGFNLAWVSEAKYLGVTFKAGSKFSCSWHPARRKFFCALNTILGTLGTNPPVDVILSLFQSFCVPVLSYGLAAIPLSTSDLSTLSFAYNSVFHKIFKTSNTTIIEQCQYYCHIWPFQALYDYIRFSFLSNFHCNNPFNVYKFFYRTDIIEFNNLAMKYKFDPCDSVGIRKSKVWKFIESSLNMSS